MEESRTFTGDFSNNWIPSRDPFMVIADSCILRIFTVPYAGSLGLLSCAPLWPPHPCMILNRTSRRFYYVLVPLCQNEDVGNHTRRIEDADIVDTAFLLSILFDHVLCFGFAKPTLVAGCTTGTIPRLFFIFTFSWCTLFSHEHGPVGR